MKERKIMFITTSYVDVRKHDMKILVFLLTEDYIENQKALQESLNPLLQEFARDLGSRGALVRPFPASARDTQSDILAKKWTKLEKKQVERTPGLIILDRDFADFCPRQHPWVHISLKDSINQFGQVEIFEVKKILDALIKLTKEDRDIIDFERKVDGMRRDEKLLDAFELKPGAFGVSFDLKKGIEYFQQLLRK